jgi:LuxR family transcriptional regulator, maltose regulon positive regulatory protein
MSSFTFPHQIPFPLGVIDRPRLLPSLRIARQRLTIICTPPGYGKTTLAAQYIHQSGLAAAWHTIEPSERDVSRLYAHSLAVLTVLAPDIQALPASRGQPANDLAAQITNHLHNALVNDVVYVLDDAHHLISSPGAEAWLRTLIKTAPPRCHILLLTRKLPDLPFTEMIAKGEISVLSQ